MAVVESIAPPYDFVLNLGCVGASHVVYLRRYEDGPALPDAIELIVFTFWDVDAGAWVEGPEVVSYILHEAHTGEVLSPKVASDGSAVVFQDSAQVSGIIAAMRSASEQQYVMLVVKIADANDASRESDLSGLFATEGLDEVLRYLGCP